MYEKITNLKKKLQAMKKSRLQTVYNQIFKFKPFSKKQKQVLTWWCATSPVKDYDGIIADGAIRSGKTVCMSLSYVMWAMETFNGQNFAMCGKTIGSFRRNVLFWLKLMLKARGYNAERLMVTELARVQTEAQKQSFIRNGFDEYVYVACTKGDVCPICKGLDDKHFKVDDMMPGENAPPMHPNCHCSTAAYMDDKLYEEWLNSYKEHGLSYEEYSQRIRNEELKLSDSTDKWAREAKRELHKSEQSIGKRTKETMEIYDANGKFIMSKRGGESSVRISLKDYTKLKNAVVTHNHPSGGSFSFTDLKFLKRMPISELRVAASNGAYYIRKPDKWPEELKDIQYMEEMYKQIEKSLKLKYQRLYNERKITKRERYQMYRHDVNKTFSERYGLKYGYETYE